MGCKKIKYLKSSALLSVSTHILFLLFLSMSHHVPLNPIILHYISFYRVVSQYIPTHYGWQYHLLTLSNVNWNIIMADKGSFARLLPALEGISASASTHFLQPAETSIAG
jgi:hypothetical protein